MKKIIFLLLIWTNFVKAQVVVTYPNLDSFKRSLNIGAGTGINGKDGYTPIKGKDYFDGLPGVNGKDGKDGLPGKDGTA